MQSSVVLSDKSLFKLFFLLGTFWATFEMILVPRPFTAKVEHVFPAVGVGPFMISIFELFLVSGIIFFLSAQVIYKSYSRKRLVFSLSPYKSFNILILIFILNLLAAIFLGKVFGNPLFLSMVREHFFLLMFFVIYHYKDQVFAYKRYIFRGINFLGIFFAVLAILNYFNLTIPLPTALPRSVYISNLYYGMYTTVFTLTYYLHKLLFYKFSMHSILIVLIALFSVIFQIFSKVTVLSTFVALFVTYLITLFVYKKGLKISIFSILAMVIFISALFSYSKIRVNFISKFSERFYKIELSAKAVEKIGFLDIIRLAQFVRITGARDISAGRFDLWIGYIKLATESPIVSSNYGTRPSIYLSATNKKMDYSSHNSIVHFIYYSGFPAGICLFLLIILFMVKGWRAMKNRKLRLMTLMPFQISALYTFIIAIIASEMVGGPIMSSVPFAWFFWSLVTIFFYHSLLIKRPNLKSTDSHGEEQYQVQSVSILAKS
jgi:hypothetical protein